MKTKYSVIPFIPAVIAAIGLKIMSMFAVDGNGLLFGMNKSVYIGNVQARCRLVKNINCLARTAF